MATGCPERKIVDAPFLELFKTRLDKISSNLIYRKMSMLMAGGIVVDDFKRFFPN